MCAHLTSAEHAGLSGQAHRVQWSQPGEAAAERVWLTEHELSLLLARGDSTSTALVDPGGWCTGCGALHTMLRLDSSEEPQASDSGWRKFKSVSVFESTLSYNVEGGTH